MEIKNSCTTFPPTLHKRVYYALAMICTSITSGEKIMKFHCCGLDYSTNDPETYWCIETYNMKQPSLKKIGMYKVDKEIVYALFCKKNHCCQVKIIRYGNIDGISKILEIKKLNKVNSQSFLERTKDMRIRQPQCCPIKSVPTAKNIPWVYGKTIDAHTQVARYLDESGNRDVFKNNKWVPEIIKSTLKMYKL